MEDAKRISFRIHEISLPASIRHRKLRQGYYSTKLLNTLRGSVEILDFKRTHECIRATLRLWSLGGPLQQSTS